CSSDLTVREADASAAVRLEIGPNQRASIPRTAQRAQPAPASPPLAEDSPEPLPSDTDGGEGATPVASVDVPIEQPSIPTPAVDVPAQPEGDIDRTVAVQSRPRRTHWEVVDDDGTTVSVEQRTVLGRAPRALGADDSVAVVGAEDSSVSNSHATVEVKAGQLFVTDLGSTNGTSVLGVDGRERVCTPGEAIAVGDGAAIELGAYTLVARSHVRRIR
ncbi:MAG: FHA domain-containing protein, partial [Microcella pacifica]